MLSNMFSKVAIVRLLYCKMMLQIDARYLCAPEAVWRISGFKLHHRAPAIQRLQIHLLNQQTITFDNDTDIVPATK
jgi:hypothetical protein